MLRITDGAKKKLKDMIEAEIATYPESYPDMLERFTFAIVLHPSVEKGFGWELFASAASKSMPQDSFVTVDGIQFHDPAIGEYEANIDFSGGSFDINGEKVRLLTRQASGTQ